jgi:hypothetical protein
VPKRLPVECWRCGHIQRQIDGHDFAGADLLAGSGDTSLV